MKGADIITHMDYTTAKEYIHNLQGRGIILGLDTVKQLLKKYDAKYFVSENQTL